MSFLSQLGETATSVRKDLGSWFAPSQVETSIVPEIGSKAPSSSRLKLPSADGKPTVVAFLRHCGCPFAEKTFKQIRDLASKHQNVHFIAVSHSDHASTDKWAESVGGAGKVQIIVDSEREIYGAWGLGTTGWWHVLNPTSMGKVKDLATKEGIKNRWTESGSRWQSSGQFAVDGDGIVRWGRAAEAASDVPDYEEAVQAVQSKSKL